MSEESNPYQPKERTDVSAIEVSAERVPAIPPWVSELEKWEQSEYDGIKGIPPAWVPEPHRQQFRSERTNLCILIEERKATFSEIRSRFDYLLNEKYAAIVLALSKDAKPYDDTLKYLAKLYRLSLSTDREHGLRQLAGDLAVIGYRVRNAPQKRQSVFDKPKIQEIGKAHWDAHPKDTMKDIMGSEAFIALMKGMKQYTDRTIMNWLHEVDPRSNDFKRGPKISKR